MTKRLAIIITGLVASTWAISAEVPDTQQERCYNNTSVIPCPATGRPFYGQDGSYHTTPRTFTKLDNTGDDLPDSATSWVMVRDNTTGLTWEVKTDDGSIHDRNNFYERCNTDPVTNGGAIGTCNVEPDYWVAGDSEGFINDLKDSSWGGSANWRVPNAYELMTLIHWDRYIPASNLNYFPNTMSGSYGYLSNTYVNGTYSSGALLLNFSAGNMTTFGSLFGDYVRAVQGPEVTPPSLTDNLNTTVTDVTSGLMWQRSLGSEEYSPYFTWLEALEYCEDLSQAGHDDWRLPNIIELYSIVDHSKTPTLDTTTFDADDYISTCWSSTTKADTPSRAWGVSFTGGQTSDLSYKLETEQVRCVRGGVSTAPHTSHTHNVNITGTGKVVITDLNSNIILGYCESSCSYQHQAETLLSLTAIANTGASFSKWSEDCLDGSNECLITMDTDKNTSAAFFENGDLSGDGRRGLEEVIMILQEQTSN